MFSQDTTQTTQRTPKEDARKKKRIPEAHAQSGQLSRNSSINEESGETPRKRQRRSSVGKREEDEEKDRSNRNNNNVDDERESWEARERRQAMISEKVEKERRRLEAEERSTSTANQELYQLYNELQGISHE